MGRYRNDDVCRSGIIPPLVFEGTTEVPGKGEYFGYYTGFEGKIYVKSGEYLSATCAESKKIIWQRREKDISVVRDGMEGRIYLYSNNKPTCLDSESGKIIWKYNEVGSFSCRSGDKVYCKLERNDDFSLSCHSDKDGSLIWEIPIPFSPISIMVENDIVFGWSLDGYCAISASTGETLWRIEEKEWLDTYFPYISHKFGFHSATGLSIYKSAGPLVDGVVYAGYRTNSNHGILTAVNALNGELIWATEVRDCPQIRLFHDGKIYFLYENYLDCADAATGELLYEVEEKITPIGCHNPIIAGNYFIGGSGPYLSFFDLGKKEFAWKYKLKNKKDIFTGGVYVHEDRLITYMSEDNAIYWFRSKK